MIFIKNIFWKFISIFRLSNKMQYNCSCPTTILILRYGFLGDILLTTPIIRIISEQFPSAKIDYWVSSRAKPALIGNPLIREILNADEGGVPGIFSPCALLRHIKKIKAKKYNLGISLSPDPFWGFFMWLCGIPWRVGLITDIKKSSFLHHYYVVPQGSKENNLHTFIGLLKKAGLFKVKDEFRKAELFWTEKDELHVKELIGVQCKRFFALFPGGGKNIYRPWADRRWPAEKWKKLCTMLLERYEDTHLLFFGTEEDMNIIASITAVIPENRIVNCVNKTTFNQLGPLLKKCNILISNDSSPIFIAAAVNCPVVVIYGPEWPERTRPPTPLWKKVFVPIDCREQCAAFIRPKQCKGDCMKLITPESVLAAVELLLENNRKK